TRTVFDTVRTSGLTPQSVEAYDAYGKRITPNDLESVLAGSMVRLTCTLEKMLFRNGQGTSGSRNWQIYANIIKVRVLKHSPELSQPGTTAGASGGKRKADWESNGPTSPPGKQRDRGVSQISL